MTRLGYRARLAVWHAMVLAVILALSAYGLDWMVRRIVFDQFDAALLHAGESVAAEIAEEGPTSPIHVAPVKSSRHLLWSFRPIIQVAEEGGKLVTLIGAHRPLPIDPVITDKALRGKVVFKTQPTGDSNATRIITLRATHEGTRYAVQVAHPLDELWVLLGHIRLVVIAASVTILAAILWTDILLTRRALRPIDAIVERARRLSESTLAERLPHPDEPGELARLVETLNAMLMRLHDSFEAQRRFTSDAAHELRSPLTRLRTEIEVAMRRPREADEYRHLMSNTLEEIQRLGELTENLLALARLDAGEGRDVPAVATTLDSVVDATVVRFNAVADARGVRLAVATSSAIMVRAMPAVVDVVLANVVDNAVKFSEPGGVVRVQTAVAASHAVITVVDAGPGIPSEELPRVFERFFRGRAPRARGAPGVGLGLAIVKTLVERQHGCVEIDSKPHGGTTVTIRLPLARAMTAAEESA